MVPFSRLILLNDSSFTVSSFHWNSSSSSSTSYYNFPYSVISHSMSQNQHKHPKFHLWKQPAGQILFPIISSKRLSRAVDDSVAVLRFRKTANSFRIENDSVQEPSINFFYWSKRNGLSLGLTSIIRLLSTNISITIFFLPPQILQHRPIYLYQS